MGGHGALTLAFKTPMALWRSVSAFSPICHPTNCPWGEKAFGAYLAGGLAEGTAHDATHLLLAAAAAAEGSAEGSAAACAELLQSLPVLVDQGGADAFLGPSAANGPQGQLQPEALREAMRSLGRTDADAAVRLQPGYDHSYHFIATFMDDHIAFHAKHLKA